MPRELEWQCECNWSWHPFGNSARCVAGFWTTKSVYKIDLQNQSLIHNPAVALHPGPVTYLFFFAYYSLSRSSSPTYYVLFLSVCNSSRMNQQVLAAVGYTVLNNLPTVSSYVYHLTQSARVKWWGVVDIWHSLCVARPRDTYKYWQPFFLIAGQERSGRGCSCAK